MESRGGPTLHVPSDICVITCYYNPVRYNTRRINFNHFANALAKDGIPLFVAEMALEGDDFELPDVGAGMIRVRSRDPLWQKEKLLNLLIKTLPKQYSKIVWLDCDLIFEDAGWIAATSKALDRAGAVQPYRTVIRLPEGDTSDQGDGERFQSFTSVVTANPSVLTESRSDKQPGLFWAHGHTGFGWAGHRDWLEDIGLYDACLSGSGDHLMSHAFCGDFKSPCLERIFADATDYRNHFNAWGQKVYEAVGGRLDFAPSRVLHLWHGSYADRNYPLRDAELAAAYFDPARDLATGPDGCWELSQHGQRLAEWGRSYFEARREDGLREHREETSA